ncbi:Rv0909 family putative TA system antitoxin [Cryobacterium tepidiphilum]|uniref:Antitoxin n=1 Tax=Cryobacterium tepidiphilum TaxID=2486026 RepID=A0A3M8L117_9MICO|nr:Rv0909 family putative TA system antitoxin [Cryobacterium tepidiphilum]RNE59231.1 antitoxin [Cryobacterium tepidiphilum]
MGIDDITKKAQAFLENDKVKDALSSEQAENISDKLLDGVTDAVQGATGGRFDEQVDAAKREADKRVGNE